MAEINVSEDRLRALFSDFKLDLVREFEKYVTRKEHEALEHKVENVSGRVVLLELWQASRASLSEFQRWLIGVVGLGLLAIGVGIVLRVVFG